MKSKKELKSGSKEIPCEIWDRTCGYYQNIANYNKGKAEEQKRRKRYNISSLKSSQDDK